MAQGFTGRTEYKNVSSAFKAFGNTPVVINDTIVETEIFSENIIGNVLNEDGDSLRLGVLLTTLNTSGANRVFTLRIYVGGTVVYQDNTANIASNANLRTIQITGNIVRTSAATAEISLLYFLDGTGAATVGRSDIGATATTATGLIADAGVAWDWTSTTNVKMTIQPTTASPLFTITHLYHLLAAGGPKGEKGDPGVGTTDADAIHVNVASEINAITEKVTLSDNDEFVIEDSDAAYIKKKSLWSTIKATIASYYDSLTTTLTNKTINAANNTISGLTIGTHVTGASTALSDTANITYDADTDASTKGWVVDEDNMVSNSATKVPTQQSVVAYLDASYMDFTENAGPSVISGGIISDAGAGAVDVTGGEVILRATNSATATAAKYTFNAASGLTLTDGVLNYIYVELFGGSAQVAAYTSAQDDYTKVVVGLASRNGSVVHISNVNLPSSNMSRAIVRHWFFVNGVQRTSGAVVSETGTRNIAVTAGLFFVALNEFATTAKDTSVSDTFTYIYRNGVGGFTEVGSSTQIDNLQYDDGTGVLATLGAGKFGVHWVYIGIDGDIYVQYGQGSYTLSEAEAIQEPALRPAHLNFWHSRLAAKIIIAKSASSFTEVVSAYNTNLGVANPTDHGGLAGLADDDHTQYLLVSGTRAMTGALNMGSQNITSVSSISASAGLFGGAANLRSFNVYGTSLNGRLSIQSNSGGNPGVEMTTDGNTTRTLIKHQEVGASGTQLEFYTQVDGGAISRYITIYENGDVYFHPDGAGATPTLNAGIRNNAGVMQYKDSSGSWTDIFTPCELGYACSGEDENLIVTPTKVTFRMPYAMTLTEVRASVKTAPTDANIIINIKENGSSIFGTKLSIDAGEKTSTTATTPPTITDSALADDSEITIDIDQVGSTIPGAGLKVWLIGKRA